MTFSSLAVASFFPFGLEATAHCTKFNNTQSNSTRTLFRDRFRVREVAGGVTDCSNNCRKNRKKKNLEELGRFTKLLYIWYFVQLNISKWTTFQHLQNKPPVISSVKENRPTADVF
jgi:hypothetical protein